jgi:hypothetical protein
MFVCATGPPVPLDVTETAVRDSNRAEPRIDHCDPVSPADTALSGVVVSIAGVVNVSGQMEASPLAVRGAPSWKYVEAALRQVAQCHFTPGRIDGVLAAVSTLVQWDIRGRPKGSRRG